MVASGSTDGTVRLWDMASGEDQFVIRADVPVMSAARRDNFVVIGHEKGLMVIQHS